MTIEECRRFIDSFSRSGKPVTDLSRAGELMERIGNPEKELKFVHIAGTNGKGSVVEYISNALILSGYKTGQFTSPFVLRYTDRIRINGIDIDEASLCEICEFVKSRVGSSEHSQFEITMAIALLWFRREKCDIVVFECGIGGLLDCTNVIPPPLVSVITSVSLDHTAILGETVEEIARQKAGIIKEGSAVVLSHGNEPNVVSIVREKAESVGAEFIEVKKNDFSHIGFNESKQPFMNFRYNDKKYRTAMLGQAQPINASTAIEACVYLRKKGFDISDESITEAIETSHVAARIQYIKGEPPVIVDGGHNKAGVKNLADQLTLLAMEDLKCYAVMGMIDSKDYLSGIYLISGCCDKIFCVDDFSPAAVPAEKLSAAAKMYTDSQACASLGEAVNTAKKLALENKGIVVVCGSLYLASEYLSSQENTQK